MNLEEQIEEQGNMILKFIEDKKSLSVIYKMFAVYEDLYEEIKNPTCKQQNDFIKLYFKYISYTEHN